MSEWRVAEGTGWIDLDGFGRINPRRDSHDGGREFFTAMLLDDTFAEATGEGITEGPETYRYQLDEPFLLAHYTHQPCVEVKISVQPGGRYAVHHRPAQWPDNSGAW